MLQFGLRLGTRPRQMVTTTPRPTPLLRRLIAASDTAITRATTRANRKNLAAGFIERVVGRYAGTRLGRQELEGELIESDGTVLKKGDLTSYHPGSHHNSRTETGCLLVGFDWDKPAQAG